MFSAQQENQRPVITRLKTSTNSALMRKALQPNAALEEASEVPQLGSQVAELMKLVRVLTEKQEQYAQKQEAQLAEINALKLTTTSIKAQVLQEVESKIEVEHAATKKLMDQAARDRDSIKEDLATEKAAQEAQAKTISELKQEAQATKEQALQAVEEKIAAEHEATQELIEEAARDRAKIREDLATKKAAQEAQARVISSLEQGAQAQEQALQEVERKAEVVQDSVRTLEQSTNAKLLAQKEELTQQSVENYILIMNDVQESLLDLNQEIHGFDEPTTVGLHNQIDENTLKQAQEMANTRGAVQLCAALSEEIRKMEEARADAEHTASFVNYVLPDLARTFNELCHG